MEKPVVLHLAGSQGINMVHPGRLRVMSAAIEPPFLCIQIDSGQKNIKKKVLMADIIA